MTLIIEYYILISIVTAIIVKIDSIVREVDDLILMTYIVAGLLFPIVLPMVVMSMISQLVNYILYGKND